jgi:asparagine synthase (glutamine-hydrolysing)
MCGIFYYRGKQKVYNEFMKTQHRGPDNSHILIEDDLFIGFHRLMINDLSYNGSQPFMSNNCVVICNGEIYNFKELKYLYDLNLHSESDCEVILHLYLKFKDINSNIYETVKALCNALDGEFAFIIYDKLLNKVIAARDRYGVRPLFFGYKDKEIGIASELKSLDNIFSNVKQFPPSYYLIQSNSGDNMFVFSPYNTIDESYDLKNNNINEILPQIKSKLEASVIKRLISDVPICALLSGGLDSSLISGLLSKFMNKKLHTFSIGMEGSTDLFFAQKVANYIGSIHTSVVVTKEQMLAAIPEVIKVIESYDITTVRASTPNYLLAKYIKNNTDFKVLLTGEMSDEVNTSYLYFKKAPSPDELHKEGNKLISEICYFDNLRADRSISGNSLEARVPFSDHLFVKFMQSINPELRMCDNKIEKYLVRKAFEGDNLIPDEVLYREKSAFSDGVSSYEDSWHNIIKTHVDTLISDEEFEKEASKYMHCTPYTKESYYYRKTFHEYYKNDAVIPHFWLPNQTWFSEGKFPLDPSARTMTDICTK